MTQYIDKSAVVAEIERRIKEIDEIGICLSPKGHLTNLLCHLNALEVKEVDLEKEIKEEYLKHRCYSGKDNMLVILNEPQFNEVAKHFFKLGLKAQKGE